MLLAKAEGSFATALMVGDLPSPMDGSGHFYKRSYHDAAADVLSSEPDCDMKEDKSAEESTSTTQITPAEAGVQPATPIKIKAGVITVRKLQ